MHESHTKEYENKKKQQCGLYLQRDQEIKET